MTRKLLIGGGLLTAAVWIATCLVYSRLPAAMPIHWNIHGHVDGFAPKWWGAFLTPAMMVAMLGLACVLPRISPRRFEIDSFASTYEIGMLLGVALIGYIQAVILWAGVLGAIDVGRALVGGIAVFFAFFGNYLGKVRRNFWMGVRTPWTLASDRVWNDTHRLAAKLFVAAGIALLVVTLSDLPSPVVVGAEIGLILLVALISIVYSLLHYKQLERRGEL